MRCFDVADAARELGWRAAGVCPSRLPGPAGNVEFFLWLRREPRVECPDDRIRTIVESTTEVTR